MSSLDPDVPLVRRTADDSASHPPRSVSVVIPTVNRPSVVRAVRSALAQDRPPAEVIVVRDATDTTGLAELPHDHRIRVLVTGGSRGAAAARQLGAISATSDLVAFLDDDDEWRPDKLRAQAEAFDRLAVQHARVVVSCRAELVDAHDRVRGQEPERTYRPGEDVAEYLFVRHRLLKGGFGLASSTLLCSADLLREVPWDVALRLHEDWDWVLRATRAGARLEILPDALVRYHLQPIGSAASRPPSGWVQSAAWARAAALSPRALGDFLLCVSAVNAASYGQRRAALGYARAAGSEGRPSWRAWLAFALQLLPRRVLTPGTRAAHALLGRLARLRTTASRAS